MDFYAMTNERLIIITWDNGYSVTSLLPSSCFSLLIPLLIYFSLFFLCPTAALFYSCHFSVLLPRTLPTYLFLSSRLPIPFHFLIPILSSSFILPDFLATTSSSPTTSCPSVPLPSYLPSCTCPLCSGSRSGCSALRHI